MKAGWEPKRLGNAVTLVMGQAPAGTDCNRDGNGAPFVKVGEFGEERPIVREWTTDPKKMARSTDVLICVVGATCGKINLGADCAIGRSVAAIRPKPDKIDQRYLWYFMQGKVQEMRQGSQGAAQTVINREMINELSIPLPPLDEQRRIVAVLDKAFAGIATATANAQKNLTNARALFESYLQSIVATAMTHCEIVPLSELASDITDGDHLPPPKTDIGVPFITIGNIDKKTRKIDFSNTFKVSQHYLDGLKANRKPRKGDVLFTVTGSFGIPVVVDDDVQFCFQRHIGLIRPKPATSTKWLNYLLMSPQIFRQAEEGATGTAQKTVSLKVLRSIQVPRLSLAEQRKNVLLLDGLLSQCTPVEANYLRKLAALSELKQSLLHKAFAGELT